MAYSKACYARRVPRIQRLIKILRSQERVLPYATTAKEEKEAVSDVPARAETVRLRVATLRQHVHGTTNRMDEQHEAARWLTSRVVTLDVSHESKA